MSTDEPVARRLTLDLEPSTDSIRGSMSNDNGMTQPFEGWLELSTLLDDQRPRPGRSSASTQGLRT